MKIAIIVYVIERMALNEKLKTQQRGKTMTKIANLLNSNKKIVMGNHPVLGKIVWFIDSVTENGNETVVESHTSFGFKHKTAFIEDGDYIEIANYEPNEWIGGAMVEWVANQVDMFTDYDRKNPRTFTIR